MVYKITTSFVLLLGLMWLVFAAASRAQGPIDTTFTFQGRLIQNDVYVSDSCDFQFNLFDIPTAGSPVGSINKPGVNVVDGYLTVDLNFGSAFGGNKRYLQVSVQCSADGSLIPLTGRIELTGAPYALYAQNADDAGAVNWANVTGIPSPDFADEVDNTGDLSNFECDQGQILVREIGSWDCGFDAGSVPNTIEHHDLYGLADDDHPQYLLVNGSRAMTGNLNLGSNRITNLADGVDPTDAVNRAQAVEQAETGGDLAGTYSNATVIAIRNQPVTSTMPISGQGLVWSGTEWEIGIVGPSGPAGGDFTGNFPSPLIAPNKVDSTKIAPNAVNSSEIAANAVGMSELNTPIGFGAANNQSFVPGTSTDPVDTAIIVTAPFTPEANGQCIVVASATIETNGSSADLGGSLRTAKRAGGDDSPGGAFLYFADSGYLPSVTNTYVWNVTAGQSTRFGCFIRSTASDFGNNEQVDCRVSYMCQ